VYAALAINIYKVQAAFDMQFYLLRYKQFLPMLSARKVSLDSVICHLYAAENARRTKG
jgi:hypothetical protein